MHSFLINLVIRYVLKVILGMFWEKLSKKNAIGGPNQFQEIRLEKQDLYGHIN